VQEVVKRMNGCQQHIAEFRAQLDTVAKRKAEISGLLDKAVDDSHPQRDALLAIFSKKIKRSKKQAAESEDEESDDDDMDGDDFEDDDTQEACPPGCEQALYDEVRPDRLRISTY
jgi:cilia- and flagella-associated protein 44